MYGITSYRISKKHLTGIFAGLTTSEVTTVHFEVGERLRSIFTGDLYEIVAVTKIVSVPTRESASRVA